MGGLLTTLALGNRITDADEHHRAQVEPEVVLVMLACGPRADSLKVAEETRGWLCSADQHTVRARRLGRAHTLVV